MKRDHHIICKALAYAIEAIDRLPDEWREQSDRDDMLRLLNLTTTHPSYYRLSARGHLERRGVTVVAGQLDVADREPGTVVTDVFAPREQKA